MMLRSEMGLLRADAASRQGQILAFDVCFWPKVDVEGGDGKREICPRFPPQRRSPGWPAEAVLASSAIRDMNWLVRGVQEH